jgi:membrane protease YdiL (CAAX protease family)
MQVKRFSESYPVRASFVLVLIACVLRVLDTFVIRSDELIGEQVLAKVGGLILIIAYVWSVKGTLRCIGFHAMHWKTSVALGLLVMAVGLVFGYGVEWLYLHLAGEEPRLLFAVQSHPIVPEDTATSGALLALILVLGNVINSSMEEGLFRGILVTHLGSRMSLMKANLIQAALFGVWHITVPIRAYVDGQMDLVTAGVMSVGYILLSGLIGFAWGYFYQKTDSLWAPWSAHALNNTVMNFLQITTAAGMPSTLVLRVAVMTLIVMGLLPLFRKASASLKTPQVVTWV